MLSLSPVALYHGPNPYSDEPVLVGRLKWRKYLYYNNRLFACHGKHIVPTSIPALR